MNLWFRMLFLCSALAVQAQSQWTNLGPFGGEYETMAIDPRRPNFLYIGTRTGQVFRSTDAGQNWNYYSSVSGQITKIVVDSANTNRIYLGVSEGGGFQNRLYYSADAGATWNTNTGQFFSEMAITDIIINPANRTQLYVVVGGTGGHGIFRSVNSGQSFLAGSGGSTGNLQFDGITSFTFDPYDPENRMYVSGIYPGGSRIVLATRNAWNNFSVSTVADPTFEIGKIYAENTPSAAVFVLCGNSDSTKILRSYDNGVTWGPVFSDGVGMFQGSFREGQYAWLQRGKNGLEHVVATQNGILKTNNGGLSWTRMMDGLNNNLNQVRGGSLVRSPIDTSVFYCNNAKKPMRLSITPTGYVASTTITYGFTAQQIRQVNRQWDYIWAQTTTRDILFSLNGGQDFETKGIMLSPGDDVVGMLGDFYLTKHGEVWNGYLTINKVGDLTFPSGTDSVISAKGINVNWSPSYPLMFFGITGEADGGNQSGVFGTYYDFNATSQITLAAPACPIAASHPLHSIAIAPRSFFQDTIDVFVASDDGIAAIAFANGSFGTWKTIYSFQAGMTVKKIEFRDHDALAWIKGSQFDDRLVAGHRDEVTQDYFFEEISSYVPVDNGFSEIADIHTGADGFYVLHDEFIYSTSGSTKSRRLYKAGFGNFPSWSEITDPALATFEIQQITTEYDYRENAVVLIAAANNGIWKMAQRAVVRIDTLISAPPASALLESSPVNVNYSNDGTAFAYIDYMEITDDAEHSFSFGGGSVTNGGLFLNIRSSTPLTVEFAPSSRGPKTAKLKSYYTVHASNGADSSIVVTTRLSGIGRTSQIGTSLKNDSLDMRGVLINASKTQVFQLFNSGNDDLYISSIHLANQEVFSIASINGTDSTSFVVGPGKNLPIAIRFDPLTGQSYTDSLIILSSAFLANNTTDPHHRVLVKGVGSSIQISNVDNLGASLNQALTIEASLSQIDASDVTGILRYRKNGETSSAYKTKSMAPSGIQSGNTSRFTTTIPQEDVTQNGLEFYVEFTTPSSVSAIQYPDAGEYDPQVVSVSIPNPGLSSSGFVSLPGGTGRSAFQMLSFPLNQTDKTVGGAFRASNMGEAGDKGDWQLYRYDNATEKFISATDPAVSFGTVESGKSYLVVSRKPKTLNSGPGKTVKKEDAHITIQPGWNMLANPYAFDINWSDVANFNDNVELTNMVVLRNGRFKYVDEVDVYNLKLEPWKGYMYYSAAENGTFTITYPALNGDNFNVTAAAPSELSKKTEAGAFRVKLTLNDDGDETNYTAGTSENASNEGDAYDRVALPRVSSDDVMLQFVQDHRLLNTDLRAISNEGQIYTFEVASEKGVHTTTLSLAESNMPAEFTSRLIDASTGLSVDKESLNITVQAGKPKVYKLIVGTESFIASAQSGIIPTQFSLSQNYPNPFNPTTTLRFGLPEASSVKVTIFNLLGQQVRSVVKQTLPAAVHTLLWDGQNDFGQRVASGIYIYRMEAVGLTSGKSFTQTRKMTLIK